MNNYWEGITGQTKLKDFFESLFSQSIIPQAVILQGAKGTGKDYFAARLAAIFNHIASNSANFNPPDKPFSKSYIRYIFALPRAKSDESYDDPYEKLDKSTIERIQKQLQKKDANPYYRMFIEGANDIKINSIRYVHKFLSMTHENISHRTIIISDAELMSENTQSTLLKQLEEPPPNTTMILTTDAPFRLRETIRSRCWSLSAAPFSDKELQSILTDYFSISFEEARVLTPFAEGSSYNALQLHGMGITELKSVAIEFLRYALGNRFNTAYSILHKELAKEENEKIQLFLKMIIIWLADAEKYLHSPNEVYYIDHLDTFQKFHTRFTTESFHYIVDQIEQYSRFLENNYLNVNILFLNLVHLIASITNKSYGSPDTALSFESYY